MACYSCPKDVAKIHLCNDYGPILEEIEKAKLYVALAQLAKEHAPNEDLLAFSLAPQHLYAMKDISRKGQLKLVPFGNIAKAKENQSSRICVRKGATKWFITAARQLSKFEANQALHCYYFTQKGKQKKNQMPKRKPRPKATTQRLALPVQRNTKRVRGMSYFWARTKDAKLSSKKLVQQLFHFSHQALKVVRGVYSSLMFFHMLCKFKGFSSRSCELPLCFSKFHKHQHLML